MCLGILGTFSKDRAPAFEKYTINLPELLSDLIFLINLEFDWATEILWQKFPEGAEEGKSAWVSVYEMAFPPCPNEVILPCGLQCLGLGYS